MISNYYSNVCIKIILTFLLVLFHTEISQSQVFEKFLKLNDTLDRNINNLSKEWFFESGSYYIPINTKLNNDIIIVERLKSIILELNYQCSEQSLSKFFFNADFKKSFSFNQTCIAAINDLPPLGATARYVSKSLSNVRRGFS